MKTYCIYLPPEVTDKFDASKAKFLVDGKSLWAVLVPPLWLIWHKMWWALGVYIALLSAISLMAFTPLREAVLYLPAIPGLYLMLEGNELIRQLYERRGWRFIGVIEGQNVEDAELRFFEYRAQNNHDSNSELAPSSSQDPVILPPQKTSTSSIGLFPLEN